MSWPSVPIGELVQIRGGGTPKRSIDAYFRGDIPWVTPKDMKTWIIDDAQIRITKDAIDQSAAKLVPKNTVLLVVRSGILKHTVPVAINSRPVAINQDMKSLECDDRLVPEFLARFIKFSEPIILRWVRATTADNYPIDKLKELRVPVPPREEQERLSNVFRKIDHIRASHNKAGDLAAAMLKSVAASAFSENVDR